MAAGLIAWPAGVRAAPIVPIETAPSGLTILPDSAPEAGNAELARRMLSPLTAARLARELARAGQALHDQAINPLKEQFLVHVPPSPPPGGYGLLVFIAPWREARLPLGWGPVLDKFGIIFASAANSGNEADMLGRRAPLALLAARNLAARYPVDPARVWIGGFSGGSRVALRVALAYPDVFRAALLNAGSDPIGDGSIPLPPEPLMRRFQSGTRLVYATGENDEINLNSDAASRLSVRLWCGFDQTTVIIPRGGHEVLGPGALALALEALNAPDRPNPDRLAACRDDIERRLVQKLAAARALHAAGKDAAASEALSRIDKAFGGLAGGRAEDAPGP